MNNIPDTNNIDNSIFIPMIDSKIPYALYYINIKWYDGFEKWNLVRFGTPMDGNCLFHAIANSFFEPYHTEIFDNKHVSRDEIISNFRKELSEQLGTPNSDGKSYYDTLNYGNTALFSKSVPEFQLSYMQKQLDSNMPIGYGYMEFIGNILNMDIYILEALREDIYITDELPLTIKGSRRSIVLYYINGHYELVGLKTNNNTFITYFEPDHSFIRFLFSRVQQYLN